MNRSDLEKITALRHELHAHPALSGQEQGTMARLMRFLRENTSLRIVEREGWFYAVREGHTPGIAFRADMDALPIPEGADCPWPSQVPGVSHACGHDGHCAALCGLALALDRAPTGRTVYLIFQPAEETGAGGAACAKLLTEADIGEVYAFHNLGGFPEGAVVYRRGLTQPASEGLSLRLQGAASHAAEPEKGRNPAAALAALTLYAAALPGTPHRGMTLCTVTGLRAGNGDFGISAGEGELDLTLRAENEDEMRCMEAQLLERAGELAKRDGLTFNYAVSDYFPETRNHDAALDRVLAAAERLRLACMEMKELWRASENFGHYLKACPGAIFYLGTGEDRPPLHTVGYDFNDRILPAAVDMLTALAGDAAAGRRAPAGNTRPGIEQ